MLKLYDYRDCPFSQKVRVVLAEKDLEFERVNVDLGKSEQRTPEFLRLNPYGKVPVLVDDDEVVYDSTVINEYLEEEYPLPRLMPEDSQTRARVRLLEDYCDNSFIPPTTNLLVQLRKPGPNASYSGSSRPGKSCAAVSTSSRTGSTATVTSSVTTSRSPMPRSRRACWFSVGSGSSSSPRSVACRPGSTASVRGRASRRSGSNATSGASRPPV